MGDMKGQVAVVTGGTRGIGLAISERLLNRGVTVAAGYATNHDHAREFAGKYADRGVSIHQGNVGHNEDVLRVFGEVLDRHGHVDILVNNAGLTGQDGAEDGSAGVGPCHPRQPVRRVLRVPGRAAAHAGPRLRPDHQHLLDHRLGRRVRAGQLRGGEVGDVRADHEPGSRDRRKGITVNTVTPGFIGTDMTMAVPAEALAKVVARIPVGRLGEPDEVARVVEFLADPESAYITGQVYAVNGGLYM